MDYKHLRIKRNGNTYYHADEVLSLREQLSQRDTLIAECREFIEGQYYPISDSKRRDILTKIDKGVCPHCGKQLEPSSQDWCYRCDKGVG